jgi:hypothetical protein
MPKLRCPGNHLALVVVPAVLALSGCGASHAARDAIDPVARAADATLKAGTVQIQLSGTVQTAGKRIPIGGGGVVATSGNRARLRVSFRDPATGKQQTLVEILDGAAFYLKGGAFGKLPGGKAWLRVDFTKATGVDLSKLDNGGSDASRQLEYLRSASDVKTIGNQTVGGVATTHYSAVVDLAKAADRISDASNRAAIKRLEQQAGGNDVTTDVWIDAQHHVRRERLRLSGQKTAGGATADVDETIDYVAFGVPLDLGTPSAGDTYDATRQVAQQLGTRPGP